MQNRLAFVYPFLSIVLLFLVSGCVPSVSLKALSLPQSNVQKGQVAMGAIANKRPANLGGENFYQVGLLRGAAGNPFNIRTVQGREIDIALREVAQNALGHAGYRVAEGSAAYPLRLDLDVYAFWLDGNVGYKTGAVILAKLIDSRSDKILLKKEISVGKAFFMGFSYSSVHKALNEEMNLISDELVAFMNTQEFEAVIAKSL